MTLTRVSGPARCASTAIRGRSGGPQIVAFAADLDWLASREVTVERSNLAQQPAAFAADAVKAALETKDMAAFPLIEVNGEVTVNGVYPSREERAAWAGVGTPVAVSPAPAPARSRILPS